MRQGPLLMKKIYFIERDRFLREFYEGLGKRYEVECYTDESGVNSAYMIKDLVPDVIALDVKTAIENIEEIVSILGEDGISQIPVVLIQNPDGDMPEELEKRAKKVLTRPLAIERLIEDLLS